MNNTKYVKVNHKSDMNAKLHNFVLENTNAGLISLSIDSVCKKFIKSLEEIPLSEELQNHD